MKKVHNEIKIGLTIVVAMLIAVIGFRLMQDVPLFRPSLQLYTAFERVDGITPGSSIYMSGVKIGSVNRVSIAGPDSVEVVLNLSYAEGIPVGSRAIIMPSDLIGGKHIRIIHSGREEMIPDGGYIQGEYDYGTLAQLEEFAEGIRPDVERSAGSLAEVLEQFEGLLKESGKDDLQQTLAALRSTSREVDELIRRRSSDLDRSLKSLSRFTANLDTLSSGRESDLERILENLETTSMELGTISRELGGVSSELNQMMQQINSGEGTLGRLIQDPSLYENLDSLSVNLKEATRILKEDPGHFLKHMRLVDIF
ncbi:MlaD family protein [Balneolales bacterium ANBcel1]|nr:MlaD family protein [Balneolales bacterium ANBcel1]